MCWSGGGYAVVHHVHPLPINTWKYRKDSHALRSASIAMNFLLVANALLWFLYAGLEHAFWIGAPGIVNLPLAVTNIYLIAKARSKDTVVEKDDHRKPEVTVLSAGTTMQFPVENTK